MSEVWSSIGEPLKANDTQLAWEIWQASRAVMSKPQRITEQDAQKNYFVYFKILDSSSKRERREAGLIGMVVSPTRQTKTSTVSWITKAQ